MACIDCNSKKADRYSGTGAYEASQGASASSLEADLRRSNDRVKSWSKFISEAYWIVELED